MLNSNVASEKNKFLCCEFTEYSGLGFSPDSKHIFTCSSFLKSRMYINTSWTFSLIRITHVCKNIQASIVDYRSVLI